MRQHPLIGENICKPLRSLRMVLPIIRHHHEHWNGSGYPDRLSAEEIPLLVEELNGRYAADGCPYHVVGEGDGYRLTLRKTYSALRNKFYGRIREARLSQAAIDVLAIVAYQQPITGERVSRLRGKPSSHILTQLVRRGLLRIQRPQSKRRTPDYYTTQRFLRLFNLQSLNDLPRSEDTPM